MPGAGAVHHIKSKHDRPHSSTLATKQEKKRIRQRPPIVIVPPIVAAPGRIASLDTPIAPEKKAGGALEVVARKIDIGARLARYKSALRLVAQHRDEFGAIVGLATERLPRDARRGWGAAGRGRAARE